MLTIQLLTKNNAKTIGATLESVSMLKARIVIGDYGSTDDTIDICISHGAEVHRVKGMTRAEARNKLALEAKTDQHFWIEPWEAVMHGHGTLLTFRAHGGYVGILQNKILTYEPRLWDGKAKFVNPVFERLDVEQPALSNVIVYSKGASDQTDALAAVDHWKTDKPLLAAPLYYKACILLSQSRYEEFLQEADQYLFMDRDTTMATVMTRYYYAMVQLLHRRAYKPALQNLNLCLCAKPLMAEFWCLTGDVYYHLLHRFEQARDFYENAIILGGKRLRSDMWPMDIDKYNTYPKKMMESCDAILDHKDRFVQIAR